MNEDKLEGQYDQAKGEVKDTVGDATGNTNLQAEGAWDKVKGAVKEGVADVKDAVDGNPRT